MLDQLSLIQEMTCGSARTVRILMLASMVLSPWSGMQRRVMTRSQVSKARQQGNCEPLLGGDSPPMRKRAPSNEHESRAEGSAPRDRISKTGKSSATPCNHSQQRQGLPRPATRLCIRDTCPQRLQELFQGINPCAEQ